MSTTNSVKNIDNTKSYTQIDRFGQLWHLNPHMDVKMSQTGLVVNTRNGKIITANSNDLYGVYLSGQTLQNPMSFQSLIHYLVGINKTKKQKFVQIDPSRGWIKPNIKLADIKHKAGRTKGSKNKITTGKSKPELKNPCIKISVDEYMKGSSTVNIKGFSVTKIVKEPKFTTEDGKVFTNHQEAKDHQKLIDIGKSSAEIIINHKSGYVLAEMMFFQHVGYNASNKPYTDFKKMLQNDKGIVGSDNDNTTFIIEKLPSVLKQYEDLVKDKELDHDRVNLLIEKMVQLSKLDDEILAILID